MTTTNKRTSSHSIDPLFLERWSPRAFNGETIPENELMTMIDAARWSPSSYNSQPWVFLYARRGSASWNKYLSLLSEFNQNWAKNAGALVFLLSNSLMIPPGSPSPVPSRTHSFDTGAAWLAFALQGTKLGWYTHGMAGFDMDRAVLELKVPTTHNVEIAIAVGKIGDKLHLPGFLQSLETPNERKALTDISFEGHFPESLIKQN